MKRDLAVMVLVVAAVAGLCYMLAGMKPNLPPIQKEIVKPPFATPTSHVVMHVNDEPVTERELTMLLAQAPEQMRDFYASPAGKELLAREMGKLKALEQEGRRWGGEKDPEVVARMGFGRSEILANYALRRMTGKVDESALRGEYEKQKASFDTIDVSHILIAYQGGSVPARTGQALPRPEAMQKAKAVAAKLRSGADFGAAARAVSDDGASGSQGGQLGPLARGMLPKEIEEKVFSLRPGQISEPLASQFGIHIFRGGERHLQTFEQAKPALQQKMQQDAMTRALAKIQKSARIELDPTYFKSGIRSRS